jgi:hypothetical protein
MKAAGTKFVGAIKVAAKLRQPTHPRKMEKKKQTSKHFQVLEGQEAGWINAIRGCCRWVTISFFSSTTM